MNFVDFCRYVIQHVPPFVYMYIDGFLEALYLYDVKILCRMCLKKMFLSEHHLSYVVEKRICQYQKMMDCLLSLH